jgi:MOSC domain-containing protein YiiM
MPNLRQVHLFPSQTLGALCAAGYDVEPGDLGENITTTGLDLEILPLDTELRLGASARVRLTGLRTPCVLIDRYRSGSRSRLVTRKPGPPFRAGVMAIVIASGTVAVGDPIWIILPPSSRCALPPI